MRYEYKIISSDLAGETREAVEMRLNLEEDWELVSVVPVGNSLWHYFKREVPIT